MLLEKKNSFIHRYMFANKDVKLVVIVAIFSMIAQFIVFPAFGRGLYGSVGVNDYRIQFVSSSPEYSLIRRINGIGRQDVLFNNKSISLINQETEVIVYPRGSFLLSEDIEINGKKYYKKTRLYYQQKLDQLYISENEDDFLEMDVFVEKEIPYSKITNYLNFGNSKTIERNTTKNKTSLEILDAKSYNGYTHFEYRFSFTPEGGSKLQYMVPLPNGFEFGDSMVRYEQVEITVRLLSANTDHLSVNLGDVKKTPFNTYFSYNPVNTKVDEQLLLPVPTSKESCISLQKKRYYFKNQEEEMVINFENNPSYCPQLRSFILQNKKSVFTITWELKKINTGI